MTGSGGNIPVALTIAGSDCSAGAGIQADLKTFSALGIYCLTVVTCVVAEVPGRVARIDPVDPRNVAEQIELLLANLPIAAIKTGLLFSAEVVELVARILERCAAKLPLVVDPVMIATSGDRLLEPRAIECYESRLFPLATLITPNMAEAAALMQRPVRNVDEMRSAGQELAAKYGTRVLLKGGHLDTEYATDLLFDHATVAEFSAPFVNGVVTHGTGCTYSAAIAAGLARGLSLNDSVAGAKVFVSRTIDGFFSWRSGSREIHALNHDLKSPR
jgi:hydroxymethylpyrimidine/phosphomethylpyrimidine kinase